MAAARDWPPELAELWGRLEAFEFDRPGTAFTFVKRLARENGWSADFAARAVEEYKRFAFLCVCEGPATPSFHVDQVWHLHLTFTRSYWGDFCGKTLGKPLHHDPTKGGPSEHARFWQQYAATLRAYQAHFGTPPEDLWPPPSLRFTRDLKYQWVNPEHHWLVPKPTLPRPLVALSRRASELAVAIPALARAALAGLAGARRFVGSRFTMLAVMAVACSKKTALAAEGGATVMTDSFGRTQQVRNSFLGPLSGFEFLRLFGMACVLSYGIHLLVLRFLRAPGYANADSWERLSSYQVAMLQAASESTPLHRSAITACALSLLHRGVLRGSGQILHVKMPEDYSKLASMPDLTPLEKALLDACGDGGRTLQQLERDSGVLECVLQLKEQLGEQQLHWLMSEAASGSVKKAAILPGILVLLGLGLPRLLGANGRPVGFLVWMMAAHAYFLLVLFFRMPEQFLTKAGAEVLSRHEARYGALKGKVTEATLHGHADFAFALFNVTAVSAVATLNMQMQPLRETSGGSTSTSGCSTSTCGGGGCGGGGCGG